jgi:hypothetical protein
MPTLEEMLSDAKIADDLDVIFGNNTGTFKMKDLRAAHATTAAEKKALAKQLKDVEAKQNELTQLATEASQLVEKLKKEPTEPVHASSDGDIDFEADPVYGPLMKKILKPLQSKQTEFENSVKLLQQTIAESGKFILADYYERRWNSIPEAKRPKDKTWRDYIKVAGDKKIFNEFNLPDPVEAFNREIEPVEKQGLQAKVDELNKTIEELKKNANSPRMPRPGAGGIPGANDHKNDKVYTDINSMVDDAFNDPTIQAITAGAAA